MPARQLTLHSVFRKRQRRNKGVDDAGPTQAHEATAERLEGSIGPLGLHNDGQTVTEAGAIHPGGADAPQTRLELLEAALTDAAGPGPSSTSLAIQQEHQSICWGLIERQMGRGLPQPVHSQLRSIIWKSCTQVRVIRRSPHSLIRHATTFHTSLADDSICSLAWDSIGELLVSGSSMGNFAVHHVDDITRLVPNPITDRSRTACGRNAQGEDEQDKARLRFSLDRRLDKIRWNGADESWVGAVSGVDREVHIFDLNRSQGAPTRRLRTADMGWGSCSAAGFHDVAFLQHPSPTVAAAGMSGQIFLWDPRRGSTPMSVIQPPADFGSVYSLQVAPGGHALVAGTRSSNVLIWDLRRGTGVAAFGARARQHSLLGRVSIRDALRGVPELVSETDIPASGLHHLLLDPWDARFAAFSLACRWSGRVNLTSGEVTHLHCPPSFTALDGSGAVERLAAQLPEWRIARGQPTWATSSSFCVLNSDSLSALNFSPGSSSPCAVTSSAPPGMSSAIKIPVLEPPISLAWNPVTDDLVTGTQFGSLIVQALGAHCKPDQEETRA